MVFIPTNPRLVYVGQPLGHGGIHIICIIRVQYLDLEAGSYDSELSEFGVQACT